MKAELAYDIARAGDLPSSLLPEVALVGRSNVGKSSLVNALLGRRQLARTSSTPGKTRRIHFYRIDDKAHLVDLPGYGYARISKSEQASWRKLVEGYLRAERKTLRSVLLLVDIRRDWRSEEEALIDWVQHQGIELRIVLTKADKLSRQAGRKRKDQLLQSVPLDAQFVTGVSARTGQGLDVLADWVEAWTGVRLRRADGGSHAGR